MTAGYESDEWGSMSETADRSVARRSVRDSIVAACRFCGRREHLRRTLLIALVVGTVLTAINQLDVILRGDATTATVVKCGLNYVVPFIVSNLGLLTARRDTDLGERS
jgi:hypothetical protein